MQSLSQYGTLVLSFMTVFLWWKSPFTEYTVPLLGLFSLLYLITNFQKKSSKQHNELHPNVTVFLLNTSALLLIQTTGGLDSFLFFLLYFLCFFIAFALFPESVFFFGIAVALLFLPEAQKTNTLLNIAKLSSFLLISPLAYFFGKAISVKDKKEQEIARLKWQTRQRAENIIKDVQGIIKDEGKNLKEQDIEKLNDIVQQSEGLEEETKDQ